MSDALTPEELDYERRRILSRLKDHTTIHAFRPATIEAAWSLQHDRMVNLTTDDKGILLVSVRPPSRWDPRGGVA
jgi:hypothetical protein